MRRIAAAPLLPLVVTAAMLAAHEWAHLGIEATASTAPPVAATTDLGPVPAGWGAGAGEWSGVLGSSMQIRMGDDDASPRAIAPVDMARLALGADGLPERVSFQVGLHALRATDAGLLREMLGVHVNDRVEFAGERVAARRRSVTDAVTGIDLTGIVRVGPNSRRIDIRVQSVRASPHRLRIVGTGRSLASDFGLPERWGLGPWARERPVAVVLDLVFEPAVQ